MSSGCYFTHRHMFDVYSGGEAGNVTQIVLFAS